MTLKQALIAGAVLVAAGAAAWFVLLRPEQISQDAMTESFTTHQEAFYTVAGYLTKNKITADITGFFSVDENYGVGKFGDEAYSDCAAAVEELMSRDCERIVSDGKTVEFVYPSTGGTFTQLYGAVIYNGKSEVDGKITAALNRDGWHLYITDEPA